MSFSTRNSRYLRISAHTVLPLYVYLDDKHIEWMTDYILQRVLEDLRPVIGPKLKTEINLLSAGGSSAKKGTVDVHRGDTYQFAYFFRKNEPHAVLIKSRNFVPSLSVAQISETPIVPSKPTSRQRGEAKSKVASTKPNPGVRVKSKKTARIPDNNEEEDSLENTAGDRVGSDVVIEGSARDSLRKETLIIGGSRETDGDDAMMVDPYHNSTDQEVVLGIQGATVGDTSQTTANVRRDSTAEATFSPIIDVDTEGEEEKPKLSMRVTYQGFTIYDRCLCVIIEPWPTVRSASQARPVTLSLARHPDNSTASREQTPVMSIREQTPLFLPELDSRRSSTPAPLSSRFFPSVPLSENSTRPEDEDFSDVVEDSGLMAFSQVLKSLGGERAGSADEDENEGDVFLGDADERRGGQ